MQKIMKKIALFIALVALLVACTKEQIQPNVPVAAHKLTFFSRVQYFKDNRTPSTDTIWTLQLFNQMMVDSFSRYNGKVYWESTIAKEVGVVWSR
jgi:hypothetical protein